MASVSSLNSGVNGSSYLDQTQNPSTNTNQPSQQLPTHLLIQPNKVA